jgi:hypothetical protein
MKLFEIYINKARGKLIAHPLDAEAIGRKPIDGQTFSVPLIYNGGQTTESLKMVCREAYPNETVRFSFPTREGHRP